MPHSPQDSPQKRDAYAAEHMTPKEGVIYRDKFVAGWGWHALMLFATLVTIVPFMLAPDAAELAIVMLPALALMVLVWAMFSVLRISVSPTQLHVQLGLFGPRIPIQDIVSARAVDYDWKKYGGWGIRLGMDGSMAYNMMGDAGRAIEVEYQTRSGRVRKIVVTSSEPEALAQAIASARGLDTASEREDVVLDLEDVREASEAEVVQETEQVTSSSAQE